MPNDRLWIHWIVLAVSGSVAVVAGLLTPDIGWLRLALPAFGAVLIVIAVAGALDVGGGRARSVGDGRGKGGVRDPEGDGFRAPDRGEDSATGSEDADRRGARPGVEDSAG